MDATSYKDLVVSRGYKYHYYNSPPQGGKHTLVLLHGWPSTSRDWRLVVPFFESNGYGVIVPDLLGYSGTDKPTDPKEYQYSLLTKDIVDILDAENVRQAIAVGHDWGASVTSRLGNFFPERFLAYATLNIPYALPNATFEIEAFLAAMKEKVGFEPYGYWPFLAEDGADKLIEENLDSFISILHAKDATPAVFHTFADRGSLKAALLSKYTAPVADYMTDEEQKTFIQTFSKGGMTAPLCYYKLIVSGGRNADEATIPEDRKVPPVSSPLFFGAATQDLVCHPDLGKAAMSHPALKNHNITIRDFDGHHWILLIPETANAVGRELHAWIEDVVNTKSSG